MRRLPPVAFGALAAATVAAFLVTQHLKVSNPLINGFPSPSPAMIAPARDGCGGAFRVAHLSFYLQHRADDVAVYIVDSSGQIIRTLAGNRHMRRGVRRPDGVFDWDGRTDGGAVAPDGTYYWRVVLLGQGRTIELAKPVTVRDRGPRPVVVSVAPRLIPAGVGGAAIRFTGNQHRGVTVDLYRTDRPAPWRPVKRFRASGGGRTRWDGTIAGRPAPAGTYLVGLTVTDAACNTGRFPDVVPPRPGTTPGAGVSVRYLAAEPPLAPAAAGGRWPILVDSRGRPYSWTLTHVGARRPAAHGHAATVALSIAVPRSGPGAYVLALRSGAHRTAIPLIAGPGSTRAHPPVLVVLPALTWQGENPVDDDGDGIPNTLDNGERAGLERVLADGLPADFTAEAALLSRLDAQHLAYELTTDLALTGGQGPPLSGHSGVVLAGPERWVTPALASSLRAYVQAGGHLLSLGADSLRREVNVSGAVALHPTAPRATDIFGIAAGPASPTGGLITAGTDGLGLFSGTSGALPGFGRAAPLTAPAGARFASTATTGSGATAIGAVVLGRGWVTEVALPDFATRLGGNVDAQELLGRMWQLLGRP